MRRHLNIIESFSHEPEDDIATVDAIPAASSELQSELVLLSARLREYMSQETGDIGIETGMQRAADMLDNVLRRHEVK